MKISYPCSKLYPNNCPVLEYTADGQMVGACMFGLTEGICPRHGDWRAILAAKLEEAARGEK